MEALATSLSALSVEVTGQAENTQAKLQELAAAVESTGSQLQTLAASMDSTEQDAVLTTLESSMHPWQVLVQAWPSSRGVNWPEDLQHPAEPRSADLSRGC